MRKENRSDSERRPLRLVPGYISGVPGSVLIEQGLTRVVCTATFEKKVPAFVKSQERGWVTAEYAMLPGSTGNSRVQRERLKINNRHGEIQRFIGRALRAAVDLKRFPDYTIFIDTDVLQADGSTRCASLNGGFFALLLAFKHMVFETLIADFPFFSLISAVSCGVTEGRLLVDLDYAEDAACDMDLALVSSEKGEIVEMQAFSEARLVPQALFQRAVELAVEKNREIIGQFRPLLQELRIAPGEAVS